MGCLADAMSGIEWLTWAVAQTDAAASVSRDDNDKCRCLMLDVDLAGRRRRYTSRRSWLGDRWGSEVLHGFRPGHDHGSWVRLEEEGASQLFMELLGL